MNYDEFQELIWQRGRELYRDMPWRSNTDPYYVLVSELMLQQTQVDRVIPKFNHFISQFPDVYALASAPLADVLTSWNGLGYNRRAKYLHDSAKKIVADFAGVIPQSLAELTSLPGVGPNTAGAILAYGFNQPVTFIETNIRTVYFHHFFEDRKDVSDKELSIIIAATLPSAEKGKEQPDGRIDSDPGAMRKSGSPQKLKEFMGGDSTVGLSYRSFYWALMDYGNYLKKQGVGQISKSKHYVKQSPLQGSIREVRGQIIRTLTTGDATEHELRMRLKADERFDNALAGLMRDGLVVQSDSTLHLTK